MKPWKCLKKVTLAAAICALILTPQRTVADEAARTQALLTVCTALEEGHVALFDLVDRKTWEEKKETLAAAAKSMDDTDFSYALVELAASLGDAHTQVYMTGDAAAAMRLLPIAVYDFDGEIRLLTAPEEHKDILGSKLTAVNGVAIDTVYERMSVLLSYDNEAQRRRGFLGLIPNADALGYLGLVQREEPIEITLENDAGERRTVALEAYDQTQRQGICFASVERAAQPVAEQAQSVYQARELTSEALLVSYYACMEDPNAPIDDFAREVEAQVRERGYTRVIVDLRYNGGGDSSVFAPVIKRLKWLRVLHGVKLYTLIGDQTFSSALMNAVELKKAGAILIGRPTGGSVNHYGELGAFEIPSLSLAGYYSTKHFIMDPSYAEGSLLPDIQVAFLYEDYIAGRDADVERALAD